MKKLTAWILSLIMVLGMVPAMVFGADSIQVNMVMTWGDQILYGYKSIEVRDVALADYGYTVDEATGVTLADALITMHEDGLGATAQDMKTYLDFNATGFLTKVYGTETVNLGYYINNGYVDTSATQTVLSAGDEINLFIYADPESYNYDVGLFDTNRLLLPTGQEGSLTLKTDFFGMTNPVEGAGLVAVENGVATPMNVATDVNGKATVSFATAGTYLISALPGEGQPVFTMPWCTVSVKDSLTDKEWVDFAAKGLTWEVIKGENTAQTAVTTPLILPKTLTSDISITWTSSNFDVLSEYDGVCYLTRPAAVEGDAAVTLTATLNKNGTVLDVPFHLVVKAEVKGDNSGVSAAGLISNIAKAYANETGDPWVVFDMAAAGYCPKDAAGYLAGIQTAGTQLTDYAKYAITISSLGGDASAQISRIAEANSLTVTGAAFGLLAYDSNNYTVDTGNTRQVLIDYLLANTSGDGWNYYNSGTPDTDLTAIVLSALAGYTDQPAVQAKVNLAKQWLSTTQQSAGCWKGNANATAMTLLALTALGEDVTATTGDFAKNGKSALDGLLYFALADNSGFGYKNNTQKNSMATEQAFRALVANKNAQGGAYQIYNAAKDVAKVPYPTDSEGGGGGGSQAETISVTFTLQGDTVHGNTAHKGDYPLWVNGVHVSVEKGQSVYHAFVNALRDRGYTYEGASSGYVTSITKPDGTTLAALDNGPNSGWMYKVNGSSPEVGMKDYVLKAGDEVLWYYTDDYTKENSDIGGGGTATKPKPEKPKQEEKPEEEKPLEEEKGFLDVAEKDWFAPAVAYVTEKGLFHGVTETRFDPNGTMTRGMVLAVLGRMFDAKTGFVNPYEDVAEDAYYRDAIAWASAMGLANGTGKTTFSPEETISREALVAFLYRFSGSPEVTADLSAYTDGKEASDWAKDALSWAVSAELMVGRDGKLAPAEHVTRSEAAQLFMLFAKLLEQR